MVAKQRTLLQRSWFLRLFAAIWVILQLVLGFLI
jgi:hypothetical protein